VWLRQQPNLVVTIQTVKLIDTVITSEISAGDPVLKLTGSYIGSDTNGVAVFLSHHSNVSSTPGTYDDYFIPNSSFDYTMKSFEALVDLARSQLWYDFHSGDSVYVACYACPSGMPGGFSRMPSGFDADYYDPIHKTNVLTSIDQTPSPVIGLKIP
jgi:hypothetical protein